MDAIAPQEWFLKVVEIAAALSPGRAGARRESPAPGRVLLRAGIEGLEVFGDNQEVWARLPVRGARVVSTGACVVDGIALGKILSEWDDGAEIMLGVADGWLELTGGAQAWRIRAEPMSGWKPMPPISYEPGTMVPLSALAALDKHIRFAVGEGPYRPFAHVQMEVRPDLLIALAADGGKLAIAHIPLPESSDADIESKNVLLSSQTVVTLGRLAAVGSAHTVEGGIGVETGYATLVVDGSKVGWLMDSGELVVRQASGIPMDYHAILGQGKRGVTRFQATICDLRRAAKALTAVAGDEGRISIQAGAGAALVMKAESAGQVQGEISVQAIASGPISTVECDAGSLWECLEHFSGEEAEGVLGGQGRQLYLRSTAPSFRGDYAVLLATAKAGGAAMVSPDITTE